MKRANRTFPVVIGEDDQHHQVRAANQYKTKKTREKFPQ